MKKLLLFSVSMLAIATAGYGATIAQWSFPDQGNGGTADFSASSVDANASAGAITIGSGYGNQVTQGGNTYIDSAGGTTSSAATDVPYYFVGDWNDGTSGTVRADGIASGQAPEPSGSGPASAGALFLSSPGEDKDGGLSEAIGNNLFITFDLTASGADLDITGFSFYGSRGSSAERRAWDSWNLEVDTGSGFSLLDSGASDSIPKNSTWGLETATFSSFTILDGDTATFRLSGVSDENSQFGRGTALDDLTLTGTVIPEPSSFALLMVSLGALVALRRRR